MKGLRRALLEGYKSSHERVKKSPTGRVSGRPVMKGFRRGHWKGFRESSHERVKKSPHWKGFRESSHERVKKSPHWKGFRESSHERVKKSPTGRMSGSLFMKGLRRAPLEGFQEVQS